MPAGGFLLIGPGRESQRLTSPGRQFLVGQRDGMEYETVLVIAPELFAAPRKAAP